MERGGGGISLSENLIFKESGEKFSWLEELQRIGKLQEVKDLSKLLYCPSFFFQSLKFFYGDEQTKNL